MMLRLQGQGRAPQRDADMALTTWEPLATSEMTTDPPLR